MDLLVLNFSLNNWRTLMLYFKESLTVDHSQVHDHLLVIEDPIDVDPAAVQTAVCPPHV